MAASVGQSQSSLRSQIALAAALGPATPSRPVGLDSPNQTGLASITPMASNRTVRGSCQLTDVHQTDRKIARRPQQRPAWFCLGHGHGVVVLGRCYGGAIIGAGWEKASPNYRIGLARIGK